MPASDNLQPLPSAPVMRRLSDGTYEPAQLPARPINPNRKKLLLVIQYYEGDRESAEDLGDLIAGLERVRNTQADVMVFRRFDAKDYSRGVLDKLRDKFDKVFFETSRRRDAQGYPFGPNQMWSDIVTLMGQVPQWRDNYYAFLPLESDCTPLRPGWISELCEEFRLAQIKNYAAVGHIHDNPIPHLNGVAVYDSNLWKIVGGNKLNGSDPQVAYDIYHRNHILPIAYDTPLIMMEYQRPTITAEDLFKPWKNGFEPAMFHGVKDGSARAAVRAKYVTFSENRDISKVTVFTYEHQRPNNPSITAKYDLWYDAWKSRGWNPIKLSLRDAVRNPKYTAVQKNLEKLATPLAPVDAVSRIVRWIALDSVGGGFMVDPEVLPNTFFPENLVRTNRVLRSKEAYFGVQAACLNREALNAFSECARKYVFNPDAPILDPEREFLSASGIPVENDDVLTIYGQNNWRSGLLVTFAQSEMQRIGARGTTVQVMEKFLRET